MDRRIPKQFEILLHDHSEQEIWALRSYIQSDLSTMKDADALLDVTRDYLEFLTQVKTSASAADFTKLARTIELGRDAIDLIDTAFVEDDTSFKRVIALLLITGTNYLSNSSYIQASIENCEGLVAIHRIRLYDHCWVLSRRLERGEDVREGLDSFFQELNTSEATLAQKVVMTFFMYRFLCVVFFWMVLKKKGK